MDKRYWFCRKCKQQWNPMLNSTSRICPHCGHKVTIREDFGIEFFGQMGYKDYGVILLILAIVFIVGFQIGRNSNAFQLSADKIALEAKQASPKALPVEDKTQENLGKYMQKNDSQRKRLEEETYQKIYNERQQKLTSKKSDASSSPDTDTQMQQLDKNLKRTKANNDAALQQAVQDITKTNSTQK